MKMTMWTVTEPTITQTPSLEILMSNKTPTEMGPVITLISLDIAAIIGGAIITESIFGWPGLGSQYINAIQTLDYPVVMAIVMAIGVMTIIMNVVADIAYGFLDPRVRYD